MQFHILQQFQGNSLFKTSLVLSLMHSMLFAGIIYLAYQADTFKLGFIWSGDFVLKLITGPFIIFFLIIALLSVFISVMITHFIVPVMALDKISFLPAFKKIWDMFRASKKDIALFYLSIFLLSIVSAIIGLILAIPFLAGSRK